MYRLPPMLASALLLACGTTGLEGQPDAADIITADTDTPGDPDADDPVPEEPAAPCEEEIASLAADLGGSDRWACTAVVRLDYLTYEILGYQFVCGEHTTVTEDDAYVTAGVDSCIGYPSWVYGLHEHDPDDVFVFYEAPSDFGCAVAVSADTGLTVFGGSIVWMGTGWITHPDPEGWRDPSELGSGCPWTGWIPITSAYDLVSEYEWTDDTMNAAVEIVRDTALPAAFQSMGSVYHMVVLRYPRSVGEFVPETAEWIVLVNGGVEM